MKGTVFKVSVKSLTCYGAEKSDVRAENMNRLEIIKMRMLRMMYRKTSKVKITYNCTVNER